MNNTFYQFYASLPSATPYQNIKLKILEDKKRGGAYNYTFARNITVLQLVSQIEKDIFEIKRNQAALQQQLLSIQPAAPPAWKVTPSWGQNGLAFAPLPPK